MRQLYQGGLTSTVRRAPDSPRLVLSLCPLPHLWTSQAYS